MTTVLPASLPRFRVEIDSNWIDYNGHLRDAYYGLIASLAVDDFMDWVGLDAVYREQTQCTLYTLEMHLHYLHEVKSSDAVEVETSILDVDTKRLHLGCRFWCPRVADALASAEVMLLHVQQGDVPKGVAFSASVDSTLQTLRLSAAAAAAWGPGSRKIEITRRPSA